MASIGNIVYFGAMMAALEMNYGEVMELKTEPISLKTLLLVGRAVIQSK